MTQEQSARPYLDAPRDGYVFIITYGRSGSTLTQNLLNAIPGFCIRGENSNATAFLAQLILRMQQETNITTRRNMFRDPDFEGAKMIRDIVGKPIDPWFGCELLDIDAMAADLFDVFVKNFLHLPEGTRVGGFKEIRLAMHPEFLNRHLDMLRRYFPNTRIVFQTRNLDEVTASSWWANKPAGEVQDVLARANRGFELYTRRNPESCYLLRYEDYAEGPEALRPLFDFLGAEFDAQKIGDIISVKLLHGTQKRPPAKRPAARVRPRGAGSARKRPARA